ncbi:MAG: efflux transporter periplasmic adaptor subunit, partial [Myxococcota bacterium]
MERDEDEQQAGADPAPGGRWKVTVVASLLLLAGAIAVAVLVFATEPTAKRGGATKETAMLVEVTLAERGTYHPRIVATGVVEAERDILLSPQVGGEIVWRAATFTPGGLVDKGDVLVRIEPADYRNVLQQRRADLSQALAD